MSGPKLQDVIDTVRVEAYQASKYGGVPLRGTAVDNNINRRYYNCFPVKSGDSVTLRRREGIAASFNVAATVGAINSTTAAMLMMTQLNNIVITAIQDNTNSKFLIYQIDTNSQIATKLGELVGISAGDDIYLSELTIANVPYLGVTYHSMGSTNSRAYYAASAAGSFAAASLTQILDADFPSNLGTPDHITGPMVQLNSTTYVMGKTGTIYGSDTGSITAWTATNFIQAIQYPDQGIGLVRYKNFIIAFGEDSTEFFADVGNTTASPLKRTDQAFIKFGCVSPRSFININDNLYWIARSSTLGTMGLYALVDGAYAPTKLSGPDEDATLSMYFSSLSLSYHTLRLVTLSVNNTKHLMIVGYTVTGASAPILGMVDAATFSGDTNSLVVGDFQGGHLTMALDTKEFWYYRHSKSNSFIPLCSANFQTTNQSSQSMFVLGAWCDAAATITSNSNLGSTLFLITNLINGENTLDYIATGTSGIITCGFQLNSVDFGNAKLKRITELLLNQQGLHSGSTAATLWLMWNKTDNMAATASTDPMPNMGLNKIAITLPVTTYRIFCKKLGAARRWTFGVAYKGTDPVAFESFECDVIQGTR